MGRIRYAFLALFLSCSTVATAQVHVFAGTMSGSEERPIPVNSPGTGTVTVTFDVATHMMVINAVFSGLMSNTTAAHIHVSPPGQQAGGVATTLPSFPGFPLGVTGGSFNNTFDMTLASSYNPSFVTANGGVAAAEAALLAAMLQGRTYFNVHSVTVPSGEIRANLGLVPEPGTWAMMLLGFGAIGYSMRRRGAPATARRLQV